MVFLQRPRLLGEAQPFSLSFGRPIGRVFSRNECRASFICRSVWGRVGRGAGMGKIGILLRGANEAFRRSARRGSGFLACAALRARTSGRLLRRTAARILSAKSGSVPSIAGWRSIPAPGPILAGRAVRLPGLMKACRWVDCCRRREKKPKRMRRRGALPTRCASRALSVFDLIVPCLRSWLFFGWGGGESGFEPREEGEPTESASRALAIGMPRSLRIGGVGASDFSLGKGAFAARQSVPASKTRPPRARLGGLSGWLAQMRALGPRGTLRGCVSRASSQVWLLRAGRRSFESSARQWARGRSKRPRRALRRKSADGTAARRPVWSAGRRGRIGAFWARIGPGRRAP